MKTHIARSSRAAPIAGAEPVAGKRLVKPTRGPSPAGAGSAPGLRALAVGQPFGPPQAKLVVGPARDRFEAEADRVADTVTGMQDAAGERHVPSPPSISRLAGSACAPPAGTAASVQRQPMEEEEEELQAQARDGALPVQRQPMEEEEEELQAKVREGALPVQRQPMEEEEEELQAKVREGALPVQRQPMEEEEEELQAKAGGGGLTASDATQALVSRAVREGGEPLAGALRASLEPRFSADFAPVRIHRSGAARQAADSLGARAFTVGRDIVFGQGQFQPQSRTGRRLLAHELTHVIQQRAVRQREGPCASTTRDTTPPRRDGVQAKLTVGKPGDTHEREADRIAERVMRVPLRGSGCACGGGCPSCRARAEDQDGAAPGATRGRRLAREEGEEGQVRNLRGAVPDLQMDLAVPPPSPDAVARTLTEDEIRDAIAFNRSRFIDPFTISIVRDVIGIPRWPAVSDRDMALAVAQWQANFNLGVDGKVGAATTRTLVRELRGENQRRLARQLRVDHPVSWRTVAGPSRTRCSEFQWDVQWRTTLRGGWIIQRIDATWNATACVGGADVTPAFTARFWEAWWVNNAGVVRMPTSVATPPSTVAIGTSDDDWRNQNIPGSRGTWSITGRLYTALTLPAGFAIRGVADAGDLPATTGPVRQDDLGLMASSRRVAGRWDCCDANPANHFHRRA